MWRRENKRTPRRLFKTARCKMALSKTPLRGSPEVAPAAQSHQNMYHKDYNDCPTVKFYPHKWVHSYECFCGLRRYWLYRKVYDALYWITGYRIRIEW